MLIKVRIQFRGDKIETRSYLWTWNFCSYLFNNMFVTTLIYHYVIFSIFLIQWMLYISFFVICDIVSLPFRWRMANFSWCFVILSSFFLLPLHPFFRGKILLSLDAAYQLLIKEIYSMEIYMFLRMKRPINIKVHKKLVTWYFSCFDVKVCFIERQ